MKNYILRAYHSFWIDYWRQHLDDPQSFIFPNGYHHATARFKHHLKQYNNAL